MEIESRSTVEPEGLDFIEWEMGPFHVAFPGPIKLKLTLDGEIISRVKIQRGYAHRGIEKIMMSKNWRLLLPLVGRIDPENSSFAELALCMAIEDSLQLEVSDRAQAIRRIVCELNRISSNLKMFVEIAQSVCSETVIHLVLRDREAITDLFESLTGARFCFNFFRYGGVADDVTEGFLDRVLNACELISVRIKEYNDIFSFNYVFLKRSCGVGVIRADQAIDFALTGPNARASAINRDVRKSKPYSGYDKIEFNIPVGNGEYGVKGDCHDRFLIRLREINESIEIIRQSCDSILPGDCFSGPGLSKDLILPEGESYQIVESPRGEFGCHIVSDGSVLPRRIQFKVPSMGHVQVLEEVLVGHCLEDLPIIFASLGVSIAELDR